MIPADWPHAEASAIVASPPHRWHVQRMGQGPVALLLHGAGASTHSFAGLMPLLAERHDVVAVDLPGQGFTQMGARRRCGLAAMAEDIATLCQTLYIRPTVLIGHSAGAAIAIRLATLLPAPPAHIIAINGAFAEFEGAAGVIFPMMAKALSLNPFVAGTFARLAGSTLQVRRLIDGTGSTISAQGLEQYRTLVANPDHVEAALAMMAQWDLAELRDIAPRMSIPTLLLTGAKDKAVPPATSDRFAKTLGTAEVITKADAGHLLHEEAPDWVLERILEFVGE